ncbi:MAG: phosphatase PAP2 family protein [Oscillospiraceae bacterium]|nr:phosphatase PAP2 family protein [Oscillospiraceae bacterium]
MKKVRNRYLYCSITLFIMFILWTALVCFVDIKPIGPQGSKVGVSAINGFVHNLTGVNWHLYYITDLLSIVPFAVAIGFALTGLIQLFKRKSILKVDSDIIALGIFYVVVIMTYLLFEVIAINYRPVLVDGILEPSYPSSTTVLVLCVMLTALIQCDIRIKKNTTRKTVKAVIILFTAFMVIGRLISGVHWFTDIIGVILISFSLIYMYYAIINNKIPG